MDDPQGIEAVVTMAASLAETYVHDSENQIPSQEETPQEDDLLVPRAYQTEVLEVALRRNTIVQMDTGLGKTFIAIMLMRYIQSLPESRGKLVVFVVPTVALVDQQSKAISRETLLRVSPFRGDMKVDFWDTEKWQLELNAADCIVLTAQIFVNILAHAYWSWDRISLVVFDEAHHAIKEHPYRIVMREYHLHPKETRPRILGLTASAEFNKNIVHDQSQQLEINLDSRLIEVTANIEELERYRHRAIERIVPYKPSVISTETTEIERMLDASPIRQFVENKVRKRQISIKEALGTLALDVYIVDWLRNLSNPYSDAVALYPIRQAGQLDEAARLYAETSAILDQEMVSIGSSRLSNKTSTLFQELLSRSHEENFHSIVFVRERSHAVTLAALAPKIIDLEGLIKCEPFIGHGGSGTNKLVAGGMDGKEQRRIAEAFRHERINVLMATSVAEEGLDFRTCNTVIRFDGIQTLIGYIQSRGRAREENSTFITLVEEGTDQEKKALLYTMQEKQMHEKLRLRQAQGLLEQELEPPEESNLPRFCIESTGAVLTYALAVPLVNELCALLPRDAYSPMSRPIYREIETGAKVFQYELSLPMFACLEAWQRVLLGPQCESKRHAKAAVAFHACKMLYEAGALDEFLMPARTSRGECTIDADEVPHIREKIAPSFTVDVLNPFRHVWRDDVELWLQQLDLVLSPGASPITLGIVSCRDWTDPEYFDLYDQGDHIKMTAVRSVKLDWTGKDKTSNLLKLNEFTKTIFQICVNRKAHVKKFMYLFCPIKVDENGPSIDWEMVANPYDEIAAEGEIEVGQLIILPHQTFRVGRVCELSAVLPMKVGDPFKDEFGNDMRIRRRRAKHFPTWGHYAWAAFGARKLEPDQPILRLTPKTWCRNNLTPRKFGVDRTLFATGKTVHLCPKTLCKSSRLSYDVWRVLGFAPSILRSLSDRGRIQYASEKMALPPLNPRIAVFALTTPSCGTGFDYQSLETLGDAFLKMTVSVHLYQKWNSQDECGLTLLRFNSIDNLHLRKKAIRNDLPSHIIHEHFRTVSWIPPTEDLGVLSDDATTVRRQVHRRALSDCMEALLAAAYLSGGIPRGLEMAASLGLCTGGPQVWSERYTLPYKVEPSGPTFTKLEDALGYKFKHGSLLQQAMTHRSLLTAQTHCYEREEFLGDALLDWWSLISLYERFPNATPAQLSRMKEKLVCNTALGYIAIRTLNLHQHILHGSRPLDIDIKIAAEAAEKIDADDLFTHLAFWDPPKILADGLESVIGAVFLDAGHDYEMCAQLMHRLFDFMIDRISIDISPDPISNLILWSQKRGCRSMRVTRTRKKLLPGEPCTVTIWFHNVELASATHHSKAVARQMAAKASLERIENESLNCKCRDDLKKRVGELSSWIRETEKARKQQEKAKAHEDESDEEGMENLGGDDGIFSDESDWSSDSDNGKDDSDDDDSDDGLQISEA